MDIINAMFLVIGIIIGMSATLLVPDKLLDKMDEKLAARNERQLLQRRVNGAGETP